LFLQFANKTVRCRCTSKTNGVMFSNLAAIECYKFIMHYAEKCSCLDNVGKKL
jgi:hypothetical protein